MSNHRVEIIPVGTKFHVVVDGNNIAHKAGSQAAAQITVDRLVKQFGGPEKCIQVGIGTPYGDGHPGGDLSNAALDFDINERFQFLGAIVGMVARGDSNAAVIVGQGGLGKTQQVIDSLHAEGLTDLDLRISLAAEGTTVSFDKSYKFVKGYSTGKALFRTLYEHNDQVIVFDDCDSIQADKNSLNILKCALDTYGRRIITWGSEPIGGTDLPKSFLFTGRVIFVSNMPLRMWDSAVKSRCHTVDVHMTRRQILERMRYIKDLETFMPSYEPEHKDDAMTLIETLIDHIKEPNLRTLIKATQARASAAKTPNVPWEPMVTYLLTNG